MKLLILGELHFLWLGGGGEGRVIQSTQSSFVTLVIEANGKDLQCRSHEAVIVVSLQKKWHSMEVQS